MPANVSSNVTIVGRWTDRGIERGTVRTRRQLDRVAASGARIGPTMRRSGQAAEDSLIGIQQRAVGLRSVLASFGGAYAVRQLAQFSDSYTNLQNRLRVVTDSSEELISVSDRLFDVSNRTRVSWEATAQIYQRTAAASTALGVTQQDLIDFTQSLNQAVIISGATAEEAHGALIQLSQGIAATELRGQELRSVLEQLPFVAQVIADHLGVARGALIKLGEEGKISATAILDAFANARDEIDERFGELTRTISQSFSVLRNHVLAYIGDVNASSGASAALSGTIIALAENLDTAAMVLQSVVILIGLELARRAIPAAIRAIDALTAAAAKNPLGAIAVGASTVISLLVGFRDELDITADGTITFGDIVSGTLDSIDQRLQILIGTMDEAEGSSESLFDRLADGTAQVATGTIAHLENIADGFILIDQVAGNTLRTLGRFFDASVRAPGSAVGDFFSTVHGQRGTIRPEDFARLIESSGVRFSELASAALGDFLEEFNRDIERIGNLDDVLSAAQRRGARPTVPLESVDSGTGLSESEEAELERLESLQASITDELNRRLESQRQARDEQAEANASAAAFLRLQREINDEVDRERLRYEAVVGIRQFAQMAGEQARTAEEQFEEEDARRLRNSVSVEETLWRLRISSIDNVGERTRAQEQFDVAHAAFRLRALGAEQEQVDELLDLYRRINEQRQTDQNVVEAVQRVRIVFNADAREVEDAGQLAAYGLGLVVRELRNLGPAVSQGLSALEGIVSGVAQLRAGGNGFTAAASLAGGAVGVVSTVVGVFQRRAQRAREEQQRLNQALEESRERTSAWARELEGFNATQVGGRFFTQFALLTRITRSLNNYIDETARTIDLPGALQALSRLTLSDADRTRARTILNNLETAEQAFARQSTGRARTLEEAIGNYRHAVGLEEVVGLERLRVFEEFVGNYVNIANVERDAIGRINLEDINLSDLTIRERRIIENTIVDINREIADAELESRREQANRLIEEIERQHRDVIRAIEDREAAARAAALRAVGAQFDFQEAALRASYLPQLRAAAGDRAQTQLISERVFRDIETLRRGETTAGEQAIARVREQADAARQQAEIIRDGLTSAVETSIENLDEPFGIALAQALTQWSTENMDLLGSDATIEILERINAAITDDGLVDEEAFGAVVGAAYAPTLSSLDKIDATLITYLAQLHDDLVQQREELERQATAAAPPGVVDPLARVRGLSPQQFATQAFEAGGFPGFVEAAGSLTAQELAYFERQNEAIEAQALRDRERLDAINNPEWSRGDRTINVKVGLEVIPRVNITNQIETSVAAEDIDDSVVDEIEDNLVERLQGNTKFRRGIAGVASEVAGETIPEANVSFGG